MKSIAEFWRPLWCLLIVGTAALAVILADDVAYVVRVAFGGAR